MRLPVLVSCFSFLSLVASAQFNMEDFLSSSAGAPEIRTIDAQLRFIDEEGFRSPLLREVEIRARDTRFTRGIDDYRLRFTALNPFEQRANRQYEQIIGISKVAEKKYQLNRVLRERYMRLINHYKRSRERELEESREKFYNDLINLAGRQPDRFKLEDVIDADREVLKSKLKQNEYELGIRQAEFMIRQGYPFTGAIDWEEFRLVEVDQIRAWNSPALPSPEDNLYLQSRLQSNLVKGSELNIRRHRSFSNIGFVQAEYRTDWDEPFANNLGMQIGVNLPVFNIDRPDLNRRRMELIESESELLEDREELSLEVSLMKMELDALIAQYDIITQKLTEYDNHPLLNSSETSIDLVIELREYQFELQEMQTETYTSLLKAYIDLLSFDGRLIGLPSINYLSYTRDTIDLDL